MTLSNAQRETLDRLLFALRDDELKPSQAAELEELLLDSAEAMQHYLRVTNLNAGLRWMAEGENEDGSAVRELEIESSSLEISEPQSQVPAAVTSIPPIVIDSSADLDAPVFALRSPVGGFLFSYTMSAVIVGVALLVGWMWRTSAGPQLVHDVLQPVPAVPAAAPSVGRVTGMVDCRWIDLSQATVEQADVPLGRKYALASGFLEITYDSGAKVLLQGPAVYEVESARGGFLSLGRLTAIVTSRGARGERTANPTRSDQEPQPTASLAPRPSFRAAADSRLSTLSSRLFSVRTPSAVVTDLGTEFGVEVDKWGITRSHVFRGKVEVRVDDNGVPRQTGEPRNHPGGRVIELIENDSVTVEPRPKQAPRVVRETNQSAATAFIRQLPRGTPILVFSTGTGFPVGARDPHWQLPSWKHGDPPHVLEFRPIWPSEVIDPPPRHLANDPSRSQWIKADGQFALPGMPAGVASFRTTFELPKKWSGSAVLWGGFIADERLVGIWLNGKPVAVPEQQDPVSYDRFSPFVIRDGFVAGTNVLVFDIRNRPVQAKGPLPSEPVMSLRVELQGVEFDGSPIPAGGKEERSER
jgi:hypothetical protein